MKPSIVRIDCGLLTEDEDLSALQEKYSLSYLAGEELPPGVEVISIEQLLRELNECDPDFYFKTLLTEQ